MYLGKRVIVKHDNKLQEGNVIQIFLEELEIKLDTGELIRRKYWEIRSSNE
jgi:hypothetical protein